MGPNLGPTLSHYRIVSKIGAGGMGEVYQAVDTKLGREVAVKVLPVAFADDPERLARFEREARLLATLNHPCIATIHGLEEADGIRFLVLELVPGETLRERLARGPLPVDEALSVCRGIAEGLEAAHTKGVIHRDLKPANVKVTPEGRVKVLDFGLAKAFAAPSTDEPSASPTLTADGTRRGVILGTTAYMSPEQARGQPVSKETDIWSFGCVLYEALTGRRAFGGATVSDTLAAVLKGEPDWPALPEATPRKVGDLLRRCLQKDPGRRLRDIGDARIEIEEALAEPGTPAAAGAAPGRRDRERLAWSLAVLGVTAAVAVPVTITRVRPALAPPELMRFDVPLPERAALPRGAFVPQVTVSPDGRHLAFSATVDGRTMLWLRSLDAVSARPLTGTEGAGSHFWSPDSRFIGFLADGKVKKIAASGGPPQTICELPGAYVIGSWGRGGTILLDVRASPGNEGLFRVSAEGGAPSPVLLRSAGREGSGLLFGWPHFLPDGHRFLLLCRREGERNSVCVGTLDSDEVRSLGVPLQSRVEYASPGFLLHVREGTLLAQPFDAKALRVEGDAFPVADRIWWFAPTGHASFSASGNGILAYAPGASLSRLVWFDRMGREIGSVGAPGDYGGLRLSPDGRRVALGKTDPRTGTSDLWAYDLARDTSTRLTSSPATEGGPVWSADGRQIVFWADWTGVPQLYRQAPGGTGAEALHAQSGTARFSEDVSSDGQYLAFVDVDAKTKSDLWVLPLSGDPKPVPLLRTPFQEGEARFSLDGKWIAVVSNESGRSEVYVQAFPGSGEKSRVSTTGGEQPSWRRDGRELFYLAGDHRLMAVSVKAGAGFEASDPVPLFGVETANSHDVSADGQRFLMSVAGTRAESLPIAVVVNWTAGLNR